MNLYIYMMELLEQGKSETTPKVKAEIENNGTLSSRKGKFPKYCYWYWSYYKKDEEDIAWGVKK